VDWRSRCQGLVLSIERKCVSIAEKYVSIEPMCQTARSQSGPKGRDSSARGIALGSRAVESAA
jgi:hypothetical protein